MSQEEILREVIKKQQETIEQLLSIIKELSEKEYSPNIYPIVSPEPNPWVSPNPIQPYIWEGDNTGVISFPDQTFTISCKVSEEDMEFFRNLVSELG